MACTTIWCKHEGCLRLVELAERRKGIGLGEKMHRRAWIHRNRFYERPERSVVFVQLHRTMPRLE
jgi:hypothetical protein